jgi:precorrin-2 dehydrogenase/sirohydrochlorin ferrochelatase
MMLPTVLNVEGPVIIFGGGTVGQRKAEYLSKFHNDITVISEEILPLPAGVNHVKQRIEEKDIPDLISNETVLVVAALSSRSMNRAISSWCQKNGILINVVDDADASTVVFPALSNSGDLSIAISTSGRCPFLARKLRERFDDSVDVYSGWLEVLSPFRERLVGIDEKNTILQAIYSDERVVELVESGKIEEAKKRAQEVFNVHSEH